VSIDYDTAAAILATIARWWEFREGPDADYKVKITDPRRFLIEADHSLRGGLLGRMLLDGKDPLPRPPPNNLSRPWYHLVETGQGEAIEVWSLSAKLASRDPQSGDAVTVDQGGDWTLVEIHGENDWTIAHPGVPGGRCRATLTPREHLPVWVLKVPLDEDLARLYADCRVLSGGFDKQPSWATVLAYGQAAIPRLLSDLHRNENPSDINPWVVFTLLHALVPEADRPTLQDLNDRGKLAPVREVWLAWGRERGLVP
jgi:hypothetical protein